MVGRRWLRGIAGPLVLGSFGVLGCGGIAATDGPGQGKPLCEDGELRLGEEPCGDGERIVEECEGEVWHPTSECREPDPCEDAAVVETEELCGDGEYFFNRRLLRCSGGLLQPAGCSCGAEKPLPVRDPLREQADVDALAGHTFPSRLEFPREEVSFTGLEYVRCTDRLVVSAEYPPLPSLRAVRNILLAAPDASGLDRLEETAELRLGVQSKQLNGLRSLRIVTAHLSVAGDGLESLDGLENLRRTGNLYLYAPQLTSIRALSSVEAIDGFLDTFEAESLDDLTGLENVRSIRGYMKVRLTSADQIRVFDKLESVGEDVFLLVDEDLICEAGLSFSRKSIGGTLTVGPTNLRIFDPASCE